LAENLGSGGVRIYEDAGCEVTLSIVVVTPDEVAEENEPHGISIFRVIKRFQQRMAKIQPDNLNRRITAADADGNFRVRYEASVVRTLYSPAGTMTAGLR